jgi:hypothetical protein
MVETVVESPTVPSDGHDHVWRRASFDAETDILEYVCDVCRVAWSGLRVAPWYGPGRKGLLRG